MSGLWRLGRRAALALVFGPMLLVVGCGDNEVAKAVTTFRDASGALASAYQTFVASANTVEEENYVNRLVAAPGPYDLKAMQAKDIFTPEEIKVRGSAVKALGDYTAALASLEAGGSSAQIEADAQTASTSVGTLGTDIQAAIQAHTGNAPVDFSTPVSAAVGAAGTVLKLIEEHRGRAEVKKSVLENDAAVQALFALIGTESRMLYQRQKAAISEQRNVLVSAFDDEAKRSAGAGGSAELVDLGERLKMVQRGLALQADADPGPAIAAFQASHDALIKVMKEGGAKKSSLRELIASAQSLSAEVGPLGTHVQALAASF